MTGTTRTVVVAAVLAVAVLTGAALGSPATTTTTDEQANQTATVSVPDQQFDGKSVTIDAATLPDGGFAVVYDQSGARIGNTEYLEPGDHENLTVSLNESVDRAQVLVVTLYRNNGTETYNASADSVAYQTDSGADVSDVGYAYFEKRGQETTADGTSMATTTDEQTTGTSTATGNETAADDSSGGVPGFTPITAVVALLAAAFVALRRR